MIVITNAKRRVILSAIVACFCLSSCNSYRSGFSCGDAIGAVCMPMDQVDALISSGEIEQVTEIKSACRGGKCAIKNQPMLKRDDGFKTIFSGKELKTKVSDGQEGEAYNADR
jgi:hypothetical protein